MDIGSVFLVLALAVLVGIFIGQPFFRSKAKHTLAASPEEAAIDHQRSSLLAERDRLLLALQELDFDFGLGKISEEDYPEQRANLMQHAASVLKSLDEMQGQHADQTAESRIEAAVAARRADGASAAKPAHSTAGAKAETTPAATAADPLEELIASRRVQRQEKSGGFCPKCGRPVKRSDKFCSGCGNILG